LAFLAEVKNRFNIDLDATFADRQLSEWIAWAERKIDDLDPFKNGLGAVFVGADGAGCVADGPPSGAENGNSQP
jgi:hypothetical protein